MNAPREPLSKFLPAGYDPKKAQEVRHINEKGREVRSAEFADLKTALQALLAMLKRRRTLFEQDAKAAGYATPTEEELVYWTYVYFNFGEFGGKQQLQKFKGKRKLSDWISNQEFPNSIKLLQTFKMLKAMKLF
jgi:negative regulator of replication initiation